MVSILYLFFRLGNVAAIDAILQKREEQLIRNVKQVHKKAKQIQNQANSERTFFALMSHELRTPLNSIINMHRFLLDEPHLLTETHLDHVKTSYASAEALLFGIEYFVHFKLYRY